MLLPLHGFAMHGGVMSANTWTNIAHELEHTAGVSHHHGEDGAIHYDDSADSSKHFAEHSASCQQTAALPAIAVPQTTFALLEVSLPETAGYIPDPILNRPQRPPQALG